MLRFPAREKELLFGSGCAEGVQMAGCVAERTRESRFGGDLSVICSANMHGFVAAVGCELAKSSLGVRSGSATDFASRCRAVLSELAYLLVTCSLKGWVGRVSLKGTYLKKFGIGVD